MPPPVVIFRTHSDIEASIVRSLLESHGIRSIASSDVPHSVFPLSVDGLGEVRISVHPDEADEARRIIDGHRSDDVNGQVLRLPGGLAALETRIGYRFRDRDLLEHALTHTSHAHEDASGAVADNESLEFLGDAVLGFAVADMLFQAFPQHDEGQKSKMKAALVSTASLAELAERLNLGACLMLGRGEEKTGGRRKQALIANAFEALVAAIYLDGGIERARSFLAEQFAGALSDLSESGGPREDHKSALQEYVQSRVLPLPEYRVVKESGPDHAKLFTVSVSVEGQELGTAEGRSKKEAEQEAARLALARLRASADSYRSG
jgi:ribonuclease-3